MFILNEFYSLGNGFNLQQTFTNLKNVFTLVSEGSGTLASWGAAPNFFNQVRDVSATAAEVLDASERLRRARSSAIERKTGVITFDNDPPIVYSAYFTSKPNPWHISKIYHPGLSFTDRLVDQIEVQRAHGLVKALKEAVIGFPQHGATSDRFSLPDEASMLVRGPTPKNNMDLVGTAADSVVSSDHPATESLYYRSLNNAKAAVSKFNVSQMYSCIPYRILVYFVPAFPSCTFRYLIQIFDYIVTEFSKESLFDFLHTTHISLNWVHTVDLSYMFTDSPLLTLF